MPIPNIAKILDMVAHAKFFSTLDLMSGFWQITIHPDDREKTAFTCPLGLFQYRKMPFGLTNAPATFQNLMTRVLGSLQWTSCLCYIDDIIIFSKSFPEHFTHLEEVFKRLLDANL